MSKRPLIRLVTVLITVAVLASACGSSNSNSASAADGSGVGELLPFSQIQASDFVFEADPTDPNRGIFRVLTTDLAICAIIWGETEDFGNFNNSLAMNGTGIVQHDVFLPGAQRGKTYFFRVQGSTADGKQFRSPTGTFTIPEIDNSGGDAMAGDSMDDSAMDAQHGPIRARTGSWNRRWWTRGPGWEPVNAIDGDTSTEWATKGDGDSGFITIDLGSPQAVVGTEFITRRMLDGTAITDSYTITVDDGETFGPFTAGTPADPGFSAVEFTGQKIRFDIESSSGGNVGAIEVSVFAPAG